MRTRLTVLILALTLSGARAADREAPGLTTLRSLCGEWSVLDFQGIRSDLRASWRPVAGGAAILETMFPGTPRETVTLYHAEDGGVTATRVSSGADPVRFTCESGESGRLRFVVAADEIREGQLVEATLAVESEERACVEWHYASETGVPEVFRAELRRDEPLVALAAEVGRLRSELESLDREVTRRLEREVTVERDTGPLEKVREIRTIPPGPGWSVLGVPFRKLLHRQVTPFVSTWASEGDAGLTLGHFGFRAGPGCRVRFSVLGGHGYVAIVSETKAPPRRIASIPEFSAQIENGDYGPILEKIVGGHWSEYAVAVEWDLSKYEGKPLRLYVVDAVTDHYGQIAVSEFSIVSRDRR